jgi:predicted cobalt transporter CbtA
MRTKRIARSLFAALFALAATGCFVFDEIDNAGTFEKASPPGAKAAAAPKPGAAPANAAAKPAAPSGDAWWKTASSVTSEEMDDSAIAKCSVNGRIEFMDRDDCLSRGGTPQ